MKKEIIKEFKEFISKGNVLDLAVGVIVGGAFSKIVTSLVNDVLMPIIGIIIGGRNFSGLSIKIGSSVIAYGAFIQNVIDFLIVAVCIFVMIKFINKLTEITKKEAKKEEKKEEKKQEVKKAEEIVLLEEIRDLLSKQEQKKKSK